MMSLNGLSSSSRSRSTGVVSALGSSVHHISAPFSSCTILLSTHSGGTEDNNHGCHEAGSCPAICCSSTTSTFAADTDERDSVLGRVASFIPTEIVTAWAAALGVIGPSAKWQRWLIFGVAIAVLLLVGVLDFALKDERDKEADPKFARS